MRRSFQGSGMTSQRARDRLVERLAREGIGDTRVLEVMREVPRHIFVDEALASRAYEDTALPIGGGQTISQPYMVARMTEAVVAGRELARVLEVGAGCGYQSAVLARFAARVYAVERLRGLVFNARERLHALGIANVRIHHGDGFKGLSEYAPFDAILVAAAPVMVPEALKQQLATGGRLVVPVGPASEQRLVLITREGEDFSEATLERVSFVPMLGGLA